jgi:NodT family efflux transporter outer membrane factor (OMF) lipoprotein
MISWPSHLRGEVSRSTGKRLCLALAATAALAACSLGPEYKRPDTPVPEAWRTDPASATPAWPAAEWWHGFGSAELDGYIAQARRANYDLAAAMARVREADAQATIAGAALLPTVSAGVTDLKERVQATNSTYSNFRQISPVVSASYMLDFWGRNRAAAQAALATATASRYDQVTVELTVVTGVATSYFQSVEMRDRLAVAEGNLASAEGILKALRRQREAGIATSLDVAQQETTVATLSAAIPPLRQQLRQTVNALAILIGEPPEDLIATSATLAGLSSPIVSPGLPSELLARRPDVAEAEAQLISANANIKVARASFFPSITLTATGGYASSALSSLIRSSSSVYSLAAGLAQPIFDGGVLRGQYAFAQARYDELAANYRKAVLTAFGNVEDALIAVQQTAEQVQRQEIAFATARRAHEIAQAQLRSGTINILTVLNTETALFAAQDALVQARFSKMQAMVSLYGALGGGWQRDQREDQRESGT